MAEKRPFLEDGSQFGVSRTQFRRMRKAEKRELMVQWFHRNFEDPAERTSYVTAEGGYLWNHGGPHDAREQLFDMFGSMVSEKLIEEVAEEVEADGITDWASARDDHLKKPFENRFSSAFSNGETAKSLRGLVGAPGLEPGTR